MNLPTRHFAHAGIIPLRNAPPELTPRKDAPSEHAPKKHSDRKGREKLPPSPSLPKLPLFSLLFSLLFSSTLLHAAPPAFKKGEKASVLIFVTTDCPIANAMLPEITRLQKKFTSEGVTFTLVHVDPDTTDDKAREHARAYSIDFPVVLDPQHLLVKQYKATRTPEAFVITPNDRTVYHGRINDLYHAPGQRRRTPTSNDLRDALTSITSGGKITSPHQPAIGCIIADFAPN